MSARLVDEIAGLACPLCPGRPGLRLALRLELETERQVVFAACPTCDRLFEVSPGSDLFEAAELRALTCQVMRCPRCDAEGNAVSYAMSERRAESHRVLTCGACQHTFCPSTPREQSV